jgi:hypothetical protein
MASPEDRLAGASAGDDVFTTGTGEGRRAAARRASFTDREARRRRAFEAQQQRRRDRVEPAGATRQALVATGEFYRGLGTAIAESFDAFLTALEPHEVRARGLTRTTFDAVAEGNAEFFESLAESSRRVTDELRPGSMEAVGVEAQAPIDYERLAELVADELRRSGAAPSSTAAGKPQAARKSATARKSGPGRKSAAARKAGPVG